MTTLRKKKLNMITWKDKKKNKMKRIITYNK